MNLLDLNFDCLQIIFNQLNLEDEIAVSKTCIWFREFYRVLWQKKFRKFIWTFNNMCLKDFAYLLSYICNTVEVIKLRCLEQNSFDILKLFSYPCLTTFSFTQWACLNDKHMLELTNMFPKLENFSPHGSFSGQYVKNWKKLKCLNLNFCKGIKFKELENIFEETELASIKLDVFKKHLENFSPKAYKNFYNLERIFLNTNELIWMKELQMFTKLKEVTVANRNDSWDLKKFEQNLLEHKLEKVIGIETCLQLKDFGKFKNLRRFMLISTQLSYETTKNLCEAPGLYEIILKGINIVKSSEIIRILAGCKQLQYLSIEDSCFESSVFTIEVCSLVAHRETPLRINFYNNFTNESAKIRDVTLKVLGSSSLLRDFTNISTSATFDSLRVLFS